MLALLSLLATVDARASEGEPALTGQIQVTLRAIEQGPGPLLVFLYDDPEDWLKPPQSLQIQRVAVDGAEATVTFDAAPHGTYAVAVIHDANENGLLDIAWLPYPHIAEGAGVSNDPRTYFGPPSFSDAAIQLDAPLLQLDVTVTY